MADNELNINLKVDVDKDGDVWMKVESLCTKCNAKNGVIHDASGFVHGPNFIERLFGTTWADKLKRKEVILIKRLKDKLAHNKIKDAKEAVANYLNVKES